MNSELYSVTLVYNALAELQSATHDGRCQGSSAGPMKWENGPCVQFSEGASHRHYSDLVTDAVLIRRLIQRARSFFIDSTPAFARPTIWRLSRCGWWLNSPHPHLLWMTVKSSRPTQANDLTCAQVASTQQVASRIDRRRSSCLNSRRWEI